MEAFLTSVAVVALAEIGDKTQLLAIVLTARFRKPLPIIAGILLATIANHLLAALVGASAAEFLKVPGFATRSRCPSSRWACGRSFPTSSMTMRRRPPRFGAFLTTLVAFFLVEMGDKTQVATIALAARFQAVWAVAAGTTVGMMLANGPVVFAGSRLIERVPLKPIRIAAALLFVAIGAVMLWGLVFG